jgi:polyhydroxyalkanoate depolymerase
MLYQAYQAHCDMMGPVRALVGRAAAQIGLPGQGLRGQPILRNLTAAYELIARASLTHYRPAFGIDIVMVGKQPVAVRQEAVLATPFATLLHFKKDIDQQQPRVLLVAPLSGHFATLLRSTVRTMLPDHDVYITDWLNVRDVAAAHGSFGFDDYVAHLIRFLEALGPGCHVVAVCQPCVAVLITAAVMAEAGNAAQPRSMTLMAGPIDARINPTKVNKLAEGKSINWFERNVIATVPSRYGGSGRPVYPGFVQLAAFMSMNIGRHLKAHRDLYNNLVSGDLEKAKATQDFYDEYFAVLDLTAEFYLETVRLVFQEHAFARGVIEFRGRKVDARAIRRVTLLTVEGERDDICAVGQTAAAHELCGSLRPYLKRHHMQAGVGHYGVFSGRKWEHQVYPLVKNAILASD